MAQRQLALRSVLLGLMASIPLAVSTAAMADDHAMEDPAWLRGHVPESTVAYVRIPQVVNLISEPKGDAFDGALSTPAVQQELAEVRAGLAELLESLAAPPPVVLAGNLLLRQINGPIELASWFPEDRSVPVPYSGLTIPMAFNDRASFFAFLEGLVAFAPPVVEITLPQGDEPAVVAAQNVTVMIDYEAIGDDAGGRMVALGGVGLVPNDYATLRASLAANDQPPMAKLEGRLDTSGHGLMVWVNAEAAKPFAALGIPPEVRAQLERYGIWSIKSVAMGWGVADGQGRMGVLIDAPVSGLRAELPTWDNPLEIQALGAPKGALVMSLPLRELVPAVAKILTEEGVAPAAPMLEQFNEQMRAMVGMSLDEILAIVGSEIVVFGDAAGVHSAIRIDDREGFDAMMQSLSERFDLGYGALTVGGHRVNQLQYPATLFLGELMAEVPPPVAMLLDRVSTRVFWRLEGDYVILSDLPQPLAARAQGLAAGEPSAMLGAWFEGQGVNASDALLAVSADYDILPRRLYYLAIESLLLLGDLAGAPVDAAAFPMPKAVGLDTAGDYGLSLDVSGDEVGLMLSFESHPLEFLFSSNYISVAFLAGVIAAIAEEADFR